MEFHREKRPTFVGVRFDGPSMDEIMKLSKDVPNRTSKGEIHITVAYSRTPIHITALGDLEPPYSIQPTRYSIFKSRSGENCLVLEVASSDLVKRHNEIMTDYGASYDFPQYKPHLTLSYDCGVGFDITTLPPVADIPLLYAHQEYVTVLNELPA
jgi:2'-5' RNA ligase